MRGLGRGVPAPPPPGGNGKRPLSLLLLQEPRFPRRTVCSTGVGTPALKNMFSIVFYGRVLAKCPVSGQHDPGDFPLESFALP